jgi:hypothetical protein
MTKKNTTIFESFVIIGSFDYDCTQINGDPSPKNLRKYLIICQEQGRMKITKQ